MQDFIGLVLTVSGIMGPLAFPTLICSGETLDPPFLVGLLVFGVVIFGFVPVLLKFLLVGKLLFYFL